MAPETAGRSTVDYVEYMNRVARADAASRLTMKQEAEREMNTNASGDGRLKLGFLLTSPGEDEANVQAGEQILRKTLAAHDRLATGVKNLVELRLAEIEERQALRSELRGVESKIQDLLSIDSSLEKKKTREQTRPR